MNNGIKVKRITLSGILLAFTVVCIFLASVLPTSKLSLYVVSSFFVAVIILEYGEKSGWVFYVASAILTAIMVPRLQVLPFTVFFGLYGLIKLYLERLHNRVAEYFLKFLYFNICLALGLLFLKEFILDNLNMSLPIYAAIAAFEVVFLIYDYVYTLFIRYYSNQIKPKLKL